MILSDRSIREELDAGRIVIDPLGKNAIQPSSVDLHVDRYFRVFRNDTTPYIDPKQHQEDLTELVEVTEDGAFILHPGEFVLGSTLERVALPTDLVARLEGKSSLGRLGLLIHSTAGFVDAGWDGHLTLELSNVANLPIALYPGMKIGQISFLRMTTPADVPVRRPDDGLEVPGPARPHAVALLPQLRRPRRLTGASARGPLAMSDSFKTTGVGFRTLRCMAPRFASTGIVVSDMAASLAFYRRLGLDLPPDADDQPHVECEVPGGIRLLFDTEDTIRSFDESWQPPSGGQRLGLGFACDTPDEVDATHAALVAAGARATSCPGTRSGDSATRS